MSNRHKHTVPTLSSASDALDYAIEHGTEADVARATAAMFAALRTPTL